MHFQFAYSYLPLFMWRGIEAINNAPVVPSKTIPDSRQNGQSIYPFSDQKANKHTLWGGTYLYGLYKGVPLGIGIHPKGLIVMS